MLENLPSRRRRWCAVAAVIAVAAFAFCFAAEIALVPTPSMEGTVLVGDHLLVDKLFYGPTIPLTHFRLPALRTPKRGEVVSIRAPREANPVLLKRVVAIGGDEVEIRDDVVYVNASPLAEPYAIHNGRKPCAMASLKVPPNRLFVLGDNRDHSEDSRAFGTIPADNVVGEPVLICWSFAQRWSDWLDENGKVRARAYWTSLRHLPAQMRWARIGKLL